MSKLAELKSEGARIVDAVKAGTATPDDVERMKSLGKEISEAKAAQNLSSLISGDDSPAGEKSADSLGQHFVTEYKNRSNVSFAARDQGHFSATEFKAAGDPSKVEIGEGGLPQVDLDVVGLPRTTLTIADLLTTGTLNGDSLVYFEESAGEGKPGTVAEGNKKPYANYAYTQVREGLTKIAGLTKVTDEMMEDYGFLVSEINGSLLYDLSLAEEEQLLYGNGSTPNLTGITERSGVIQVDATAETLADKIFGAQMQVQEASRRLVDGLVINPADYEALRLSKDSNGQYLGGGPFQGQYGVGGVAMFPPLWGLRTVVTPAIKAGTILAGAFSDATLFRRGGVRVDAANTNVDDFERNLVTIRAEERIALKVPRPSAFAEITVSGTSGE